MANDVWEYRVTTQTESPLDNQAKLNRLGEEGWELVGVTNLGAGRVPVAYLKRKKQVAEGVSLAEAAMAKARE